MAITTEMEEKIKRFEGELRAQGDRLTPTEVFETGAGLQGKRLQDALRPAIYIERIHQERQHRDWDGLLPVDDFMETFRENI